MAQNMKIPNPIPSASPSFDADKLQHLLEHDNHETRQKFREVAKDPIFIPKCKFPHF
jgi:hypothetical protein